MLVDIIVFDGVDEMDALGPLEVLRRAGLVRRELTSRLVVADKLVPVVGGCGLTFLPDALFRPGEADVLVVAGGGWTTRAPRGAWAQYQLGELTSLLQQASERASVTAGVCTGTMLLAHAGVIGARRANTHRAAQQDLSALGATVIDERVVDDGDLVTSGGVTSGIDLALWLVERNIDLALAAWIAQQMEYVPFRPGA